MNTVLLLLGIIALVLAAIDGYQAVTGKRLFNPPPVEPVEGEDPKPPKSPEAQKRLSTMSAALLGVAGLVLIVLAFL